MGEVLQMISYIPLGWRCSTTVLCDKLCEIESFAFRGMYSKFEGIIDCFESGFKNYFPDIENFILLNGDPKNEHHKKIWTFHETLKNSEGDPQRIAFNNNFFCWFYFDLRKNEIMKKMRERIDSTNDRVVFVRSILDQHEIEMFDKFRDCINLLFPDLDWHLVYLHDQHENLNNSPAHYIHKGEYTFINATTHPIKPDFALETINQLKDFKKLRIDSKDIKISTSTLNQDAFFTL
jgi:hypothetical protein